MQSGPTSASARRKLFSTSSLQVLLKVIPCTVKTSVHRLDIKYKVKINKAENNIKSFMFVNLVLLKLFWLCYLFFLHLVEQVHLREGLNGKKTFSFGHCPNHLNPPPLTPIRATSSFFLDVKIQDLKVSLELEILYILYNILYIYNSSKYWHFGGNRLFF